MGHLYQRGKKKTWYLKYYHGGKQVLKSLKTQNYRVARDKAKLLEAGIETANQNERTSDPVNRIHLSVALEEFCIYLKSIRTESSYKNECTRLRRIFGDICPMLNFIRNKHKKGRSYIDAKYLDEITSFKVNKFLQYRRNKEGVSSTTLSRDREILHKLFTWAEEHFGYTENPIKAVKRPVINAPVIRFMDKADITKQIKALGKSPQLKAMVAIYIYAGLRREEALWLTHDDIDLKRNMIYIRAKEINKKFWQPKTKKNRAVPISKSLRRILKQYKGDKNNIWYFPFDADRKWHPATFSRYISEINEKAGLEWTCLDFRHTFGSQLARRGVSLYKISEFMGNSPEICRRHYAAIRTEHLHDDVEFNF